MTGGGRCSRLCGVANVGDPRIKRLQEECVRGSARLPMPEVVAADIVGKLDATLAHPGDLSGSLLRAYFKDADSGALL